MLAIQILSHYVYSYKKCTIMQYIMLFQDIASIEIHSQHSIKICISEQIFIMHPTSGQYFL